MSYYVMVPFAAEIKLSFLHVRPQGRQLFTVAEEDSISLTITCILRCPMVHRRHLLWTSRSIYAIRLLDAVQGPMHSRFSWDHRWHCILETVSAFII